MVEVRTWLLNVILKYHFDIFWFQCNWYIVDFVEIEMLSVITGLSNLFQTNPFEKNESRHDDALPMSR